MINKHEEIDFVPFWYFYDFYENALTNGLRDRIQRDLYNKEVNEIAWLNTRSFF